MNAPIPILCPECGQALSADSPHQVCPACLLRQALASRTEVGPDEAREASPPPAPEVIAEKFPQFEVTECLGRGGMGVVYKARQKSLDRWVAIKILPPERVGEERFAERFAREAALLAKLSHPNIVTVHDFGQADELFFIVMEYIDGVSLRDLLRDGKLAPEQALAIVPPICEALQYAHDKGIIHRDIKPENILLDREGRVKVADFGLAKIVGVESDRSDGSDRSDRSDPDLTMAGKIMGTPHYMSPEQIQAPGAVDHRADIYALGVVFYQMLTGELPGQTLEPPSRKVQIDVRLDEIVLRALEKKPELRYQQASLLRTQVETIAEGGAGVPPVLLVATPTDQVSGQAQSPARGMRALPAVLLLLCLAGLAMMTFSGYAIWKNHVARKWPITEGRITHSRTFLQDASLGKPGNAKVSRAEVTFAYNVNGRGYESSRISYFTNIGGGSKRTYSPDYAVKYPEGTPIKVAYDPTNPAEAVVETASDPYGWLALGLLLFISFPVWRAVNAGSGSRESAQSGVPATSESQRRPAPAATGEPRSSRMALGYVAILFAVLSGIIPTIFYWWKPWAAPWLSPAGQDILLWLTLVVAVLALVFGFRARKTWPGVSALILGGINLTIWILFFAAGTFATFNHREKSETPPTNATMSFAPVMERVLPLRPAGNSPGHRQVSYIDFQTGSVICKQWKLEELAREEDAWNKANGVDALADEVTKEMIGGEARDPNDIWPRLVGSNFGTVFVPAEAGGTFDSLRAEDVDANLQRMKEANVSYDYATTADPYWFRTGDGAKGVVQILGRTEDGSGMRIRYKLVQSVPTTGTAAPAGKMAAILPGSEFSRKVCDPGDSHSNCLVSLDTGDVSALPEELKSKLEVQNPPETDVAFTAWMKEHKSDAVARFVVVDGKVEKFGLRTFGALVIPIDDAMASAITPAEVAKRFQDYLTQWGMIFDVNDLMTEVGRPAAYLLQARSGRQGILRVTGFDEHPRSVNIHFKLTRIGSEDHPMPFGPVMQRIIPANTESTPLHFDLDAGSVVGWEPGQHVADFAASPLGPNPGLSTLGTGLVSVPLDDTAFDALSSDQLAAALAQATTDTIRFKQPLPQTVGFRTRAGNSGILQIVASDPEFVKIRYKLVQTTTLNH